MVMLGARALLKALQSRSLPVQWITILREQKSLRYLPGSSCLQSGTVGQRGCTAAEEHVWHKKSYQHLRCDMHRPWDTKRFWVVSQGLVTP